MPTHSSVAVGEHLPLPHRHLRLEVVDEPARGLERLAPVGGGGGDDDRDVADAQQPGAVHGGQRAHRQVGGDRLGDAAQRGLGVGVRAVLQLDDLAAAVDLADQAGEGDDAAGAAGPRRRRAPPRRRRGCRAGPAGARVGASTARTLATAPAPGAPHQGRGAHEGDGRAGRGGRDAGGGDRAGRWRQGVEVRLQRVGGGPGRATSPGPPAAAVSTTSGASSRSSSPGDAADSPVRCSRSAVDTATAAGSSSRLRPLRRSTSRWVTQPALATAAGPVSPPSTATSSADSRSSPWQSCQTGSTPRTASSREADRPSSSALSYPGPERPADQRRGAQHRDLQPGAGGVVGQPLDLQQVADQRAAGVGRAAAGPRRRAAASPAVRRARRCSSPAPPARRRRAGRPRAAARYRSSCGRAAVPGRRRRRTRRRRAPPSGAPAAPRSVRTAGRRRRSGAQQGRAEGRRRAGDAGAGRSPRAHHAARPGPAPARSVGRMGVPR